MDPSDIETSSYLRGPAKDRNDITHSYVCHPSFGRDYVKSLHLTACSRLIATLVTYVSASLAEPRGHPTAIQPPALSHLPAEEDRPHGCYHFGVSEL